MTLEQYAAIAEIIGVVSVLVTLVFLTLQVRQNTRALKATTIQAALQSEIDVAAMLLEHASTWHKVMTAAPLEAGEETRKAIGLYNVFMIDTENRYHQYHSGYLGAQSWQARLGTLPRVVALPVFDLWRDSVGALSHSADFLALLDGCVSGTDPG